MRVSVFVEENKRQNESLGKKFEWEPTKEPISEGP